MRIRRWTRRLLSWTVIGVIAILLFLLVRQANASDGVFACWHYDGNIIMTGYFHPAALEGGPIGGPDINGGLYIEIGEDCDYRVGSEPVNENLLTPTPTPIPTPEPTAMPNPTPTPIPTPVDHVEATGTCSWMPLMHTFDELGYYAIVTEADWQEC